MINSTKSNLDSLAIPYNNNQPADSDLWDGFFTQIFLLKVEKFLSYDAQNIICSLLRIETFIQQCSLSNKSTKNFLELMDIRVIVQCLINTIYKLGWDKLIKDNNKSFYQYISSYFVRNSMTVSNIPKLNPPINLVILNRSKLTKPIFKRLYIQASKINIEDIIHIKNLFLTLSSRKLRR